MKKIFTGLLCCAALLSSATLSAEIVIKNGDKIAFLGDSITAQGDIFSCGYINLVMSALKINGVNAQKVPAGRGGNKSYHMLARLERDVLSKKPQYMTLSCGMNDVWHGKRGVPLDKYKVDITKIVEKAQAAGIKVYILTATMIGEDQKSKTNQKLIAYNDFLRQLAKEKNCVLVDLNKDMQEFIASIKKKYPKLKNCIATYDGVHMNPMGNIVMARGLLKAFGLTGEQIAKCEADWNKRHFPLYKMFDFTVSEYKKLSDIAFATGKDVPSYIKSLVNKDLKK
ncbi:MAG: hypothetical protein IKB16_00180 [Lentisphaeria bacterium]|nr:hypothetical protein [Lentisphaeria bacterium]